jgi:hypothetical protein
MPSQEQPSHIYRSWVRAQIEKINKQDPRQEHPRLARTARKGSYGPYDPEYKLNLMWLAELISEAMDNHLLPKEIFAVLREHARALPKVPAVRQDLLDMTQKTLARCARTAGNDIAFDDNLVEMCMPAHQVTPLGLNPSGLDHEALGFFRVSSWNRNREMVESENVGQINKVVRADVIARHRHTAGWIRDQELYDQLLAGAQADNMGRDCPSLVSYRPDEREGGESEKLHLNVSQSIYSKHVALRNYMRVDHQAYEDIRHRIQKHIYVDGMSESLRDIIRVAPESNIVINVTVQSRDGSVMLIRRPTDARVWRSFYQAGAHETMNWPGPQQPFETWFDLARRALKEEIGLENPDDYRNKIVFSWFGFYAPECSGYFFAHTQTRLTKAELVAAVANSPGVWEADAIEWLKLDPGSVDRVLKTWTNGPWEDDALADEDGRRWLPHATISLTQLLRVTRQGMFKEQRDEQ